MSASASGADTNGSASARHRAHHDGREGRAYTAEQKSAVIRVRRCSPTAFYDILGLEEVRTTVTDTEIKKAYRKLSLLTHPDKNGYDGADEAFKMVSRAFQILSDPDKKAKFDRFGGDPDNRFSSASAGAGASPFSGFARSPGGPSARAGGPGATFFEEEISPEEMFRQFFGGGMGGFGGPFGEQFLRSHQHQYQHRYRYQQQSQQHQYQRRYHYQQQSMQHQYHQQPQIQDLYFKFFPPLMKTEGGGMFDTGPGFVFNIGGGPGIRVHQFGGMNPRRRPHPHAQAAAGQAAADSGLSSFISLLPLLLLFIIPILSSIFSGGSSTGLSGGPSYRFDSAVPPHTMQRMTPRLKIPYWVDPAETEDLSPRRWREVDKQAEVKYMGQLNVECGLETRRQEQLVSEAQGWFFQDQDKMRAARSMEKKSCKRRDDLLGKL
ncbi:hypothetical protein BDY21DRAFT_368782 [Lineolata rhizophorae]|uniref:J domain-containing protein n=1 Tax=Lineolata rhizophorae TaxID=578093 RepID=A0A6A6PCS9_9PEZI|nr:hypothetical protein BDY21DRAFT_368782 [Lineolata rhizophorae]